MSSKVMTCPVPVAGDLDRERQQIAALAVLDDAARARSLDQRGDLRRDLGRRVRPTGPWRSRSSSSFWAVLFISSTLARLVERDDPGGHRFQHRFDKGAALLQAAGWR
jgi:hypothetical protein